MNKEIKRAIILEHNSNPKNFEKIEDTSYITIKTNNINCIDKFDLQVKTDNGIIVDIFDLQVKTDNGIIVDIKFNGEGCAIAKATTSMMSELIKNKPYNDAITLINEYQKMVNEEAYDEDILEEANAFNEIYKQANRKQCALLTWDAMKEYLKDQP